MVVEHLDSLSPADVTALLRNGGLDEIASRVGRVADEVQVVEGRWTSIRECHKASHNKTEDVHDEGLLIEGMSVIRLS